MIKTRLLTTLATGALVLSVSGIANAQTAYGQTPYGQPPYGQAGYGQSQPTTQSQFGDILNALFGNGSSLDGQWLRGQRPLNAGRAQFEARLSADVRSGALNTSSAARLRLDYDALVQQEAAYGADGRFTTQERADLNQRYTDLTTRVDAGGDYGGSNGPSVADGQTAFNARVDNALSRRTLTRTQATRLRADYQTLIGLEAGYARDGISARERDDLDAQLDALDARVGDGNAGGGYGNGVLDNRTRLANIDTALNAGERSGAVSRTEAADIRVEAGDLARLEAAYARSGPSREDTDYLTRRIGELEVRARVNRYR